MVSYEVYTGFPGWDDAPSLISAIRRRQGARTVLELGGGRTPTLTVDEVRREQIRYTVNDIDAEELALVDPAYDTLAFDMAAPLSPEVAEHRYDLIFSRMVNEHVADGHTYYRNIFGMLEPGGVTVHCFATFYSVPMVVNRFLPESLASPLQAFVFRDAERTYEKFPARYSWCRGPSPLMHRRLADIGFEVLEYRGYFGHGYYHRIAALHRLEQLKARWLAAHPVNALTTYAVIVARRPG
jgi:hypothetical protein